MGAICIVRVLSDVKFRISEILLWFENSEEKIDVAKSITGRLKDAKLLRLCSQSQWLRELKYSSSLELSCGKIFEKIDQKFVFTRGKYKIPSHLWSDFLWLLICVWKLLVTYPRLGSGIKITGVSLLGSLTPYGFSAFTLNLYWDASIRSSRVVWSWRLVTAFSHTFQLVWNGEGHNSSVGMFFYHEMKWLPCDTRRYRNLFCSHHHLLVVTRIR